MLFQHHRRQRKDRQRDKKYTIPVRQVSEEKLAERQEVHYPSTTGVRREISRETRSTLSHYHRHQQGNRQRDKKYIIPAPLSSAQG
ncbi:hypothetical protein PoB_001825400 [Plakobranchus ocellatus]|uniref:Uncharacterized protein n=1 Tax=Plakobranchus ocellatus TaxID=259542 RepID=A0AAV3ZCY3_9GAST|nr:hypothetical protein PoB_001825400 [Plakobranchus ocellatus]